MSNFQSFGAVTEGLEGSAPARFIASTTDSFASIVAAGYLNDKAKIVKANDIFDINYSDASSFPLNVGEASLFASFLVQYDPTLGNWNLIPRVSQAVNISNYGVHSDSQPYAGGSASFSLNDSAITPNSVVIARFQSSANSSEIKTVLPGNGTLAIVASADPGASVLEYISILPNVPLQNLGVYAAQYSNAGGSATIVISNPAITASMVPVANFASQANAAEIKKVTASAGAITIVASTDPGVSVIEYAAALPSSALTNLGYYAAQYTNAGGSATTSISDSNITAASEVVADWSSQANAAVIYKVTPGAGSLTILSSADPGASVLNYHATPDNENSLAGTYLLASNNLSDVASASASASNLGLGTANNVVFAGVQTLNLKYGATPVAQVDPGSCTITAAAGATNHCTITIQLKDGSGTNMSRVIPFKVYLATDATGLTLQSAASTGYSVTSGGVKDPTGSTTITQGLAAFSSASGGCVVDLLDTGKGTGNLILMFANGFKASAAITSGSYG